MAFTLIASNGTLGGANGVNDGATINSTGANLLIAIGISYTAIGEPTISDSKSNSWSTGITDNRVGDQRVTVFYSIPTSVGSGHTFDFGATDTYSSILVQAWSGAASSDVYDTGIQSSGKTGSATTLAAGSITPSDDDYLVVVGIGLNTASTLTIDSPATISNQVTWSSGTAFGGGMGYIVQTSAISANPAWSWTGSTSAVAVACAFKVSAGGATRPVKMAGEWGGYAGSSGGFAG